MQELSRESYTPRSPVVKVWGILISALRAFDILENLNSSSWSPRTRWAGLSDLILWKPHWRFNFLYYGLVENPVSHEGPRKDKYQTERIMACEPLAAVKSNVHLRCKLYCRTCDLIPSRTSLEDQIPLFRSLEKAKSHAGACGVNRLNPS